LIFGVVFIKTPDMIDRHQQIFCGNQTREDIDLKIPKTAVKRHKIKVR
jgi:hypothetical protein